jgi:hypothetical protein
MSKRGKRIGTLPASCAGCCGSESHPRYCTIADPGHGARKEVTYGNSVECNRAIWRVAAAER